MMLNNLRRALGFLTWLPVPWGLDDTPSRLGSAGFWFPLVGALIGGLLALAGWGLAFILPPLAVGLLLTALWALLTGGLHLDGLADSCDGLFCSAGPEKSLEIMKDPRLGSFGAIGLMLTLLFKIIFSAEMVSRGQWLIFPAAAALARWALLLLARQPNARPGGLGSAFGAGVRPWMLWLSAPIPLVLIYLAGKPGWVGLVLASISWMMILMSSRRKLGGVTGDILGLAVEISEIMVLLGATILI